MEDNMSWPPCSNNRFGIRKHLLNHILVTEAINRPQKSPNMVLYGMLSQPYIQYPVRARAYVRSRLSLVYWLWNVSCFVFLFPSLMGLTMSIPPLHHFVQCSVNNTTPLSTWLQSCIISHHLYMMEWIVMVVCYSLQLVNSKTSHFSCQSCGGRFKVTNN